MSGNNSSAQAAGVMPVPGGATNVANTTNELPNPQLVASGLQYLRRAQLLLGTASGEALDVSNLRVRFNIVAGDRQTPKSISVRVYNLSDQTVKLVSQIGSPIRLSVAYGSGALTPIFNGNLVYFRAGRESPTDTYLELEAGDGDSAYIQTIVNKTLAKGYSHSDVVGAACTAANPFGVQQGEVSGLPQTAYPRGRALYGMARSSLRDVARSTGTTWSVENGQLNVRPAGQAAAGDAVVLTSATGLIGMPQQTPEGIAVRCLLNPQIRQGGMIQIANKLIQRASVGVGVQAQTQAAFLPRVTEDGFYRVLLHQMRGDTRGGEWFSDLVCVAKDAPETPSFASRGYLQDGSH